MSAGYSDKRFFSDNPGEGLRSVERGNSPSKGSKILRVVGPESRREDDCINVPDVAGVLPNGHRDAQFTKGRRVVVLATVRAGHHVTGLEKHPSDTAHSRTADPDEVNCADRRRKGLGKIWRYHRANFTAGPERG